jgi:hypothetical protein
MRLIALMMTLTLVAEPAAAQMSAESPEAVAERYVSAMRTQKWSAMADLMHPEALAKFRTMFSGVVHSPRAGPVREQLFGGATPARLDSLNDAQFYALVIAVAMSADPELQTAMDSARMEILGHVDEGSDISHVVFRMRLPVGPVTVAKLDVITFKRYRNTWLTLLRADLEIMAAALQQRFGT